VQRSLAMFLIGILLGLVIMYCLASKRVEQVYWEKESLKVEIYELTQQINIIQEHGNAISPPVVEEIKLDIRFEDNSFVEPELKRQIYGLVKGLLGQEVLALPYPLVLNLLEGRTLEFDGKTYTLDVEAVLIGEKVVYYILAEKKENES